MVLLYAGEPALAFAAGWVLLAALRLGPEKGANAVPSELRTALGVAEKRSDELGETGQRCRSAHTA